MKNPIIDICDSYIAVADKNSNDIYIFDEDGRIGKVKTTCRRTLSFLRKCVANRSREIRGEHNVANEAPKMPISRGNINT